jgi:hypothetical protein
MNRDQQLAAFVTGIIRAALDQAHEAGYPPHLGPLRVDIKAGSWFIGAADNEGSACTVTIVPGKWTAITPGGEKP